MACLSDWRRCVQFITPIQSLSLKCIGKFSGICVYIEVWKCGHSGICCYQLIINQVSQTNKSFCLKIEQKIPVWLFYSALDVEKRLVLGSWTVMQNSVLRSWDGNLTIKSALGRDKTVFFFFFQYIEHKTCTNISIHHKKVPSNFQSTTQIRIDQYWPLFGIFTGAVLTG